MKVTIKNYLDEDLEFKNYKEFNEYVIDSLDGYFREDLENNLNSTELDLDHIIEMAYDLQTCKNGRMSPKQLFELLCKNEGNYEECEFIEG